MLRYLIIGLMVLTWIVPTIGWLILSTETITHRKKFDYVGATTFYWDSRVLGVLFGFGWAIFAEELRYYCEYKAEIKSVNLRRRL